MGKPRDGLHNHTPAIAVLLVATALLYFVNKERTDSLYDALDAFKGEFGQYKQADAKQQAAAVKQSRGDNSARSKDASEAKKSFEKFVQATDKNFQAAHESIKTTNVEVEQVKQVLSGLDNHVSGVEARHDSDISYIRGEISGTNAAVSANSARASKIEGDMKTGFGGIEEFYKDIKAQTEWAVHGPGGCNDVFANGEAKHPWKLTRSFVHSRKKIELEQCRLLCKSAPWGCKYVSFYGAGKGWCYGFQSCDSHTTGQGWGGYTTYARRGLKDKLNDYVE